MFYGGAEGWVVVTSKINSLAYLRHYVGVATSLQIYKTTILPIMEYANFTYTVVPNHLSKKLQRLQNRAVKIIYKCHDNQALPKLHTQAKLTSIDQRASKQLTCLMYKRSHNPTEFPQIQQTHASRSAEKIKFDLLKPNNEKFKKFPLYAGAKLWDTLELSTQCAPEYHLFKAKLPKTPNFTSYPVN